MRIKPLLTSPRATLTESSIEKTGIKPFLSCNYSPRILQSAFKCIAQATCSIVSVLLPDRCGLCQQLSDDGYCENCQELLPWIEQSCKLCGTALANGDMCGHCQNAKPLWLQTIVPFRYVGPVVDQIQLLKYQEKLSVVSPLSRMLAKTVIKRSAVMPDILIPVPLHAKSLRKRGYNQSAMIAHELGKLLEIPVREDLIFKNRITSSQTQLDQKQRQQNVKSAFTVAEPVADCSIAIIDDVITSGATVSEVCKSLSNRGYKQISVWAIAKTDGIDSLVYKSDI